LRVGKRELVDGRRPRDAWQDGGGHRPSLLLRGLGHGLGQPQRGREQANDSKSCDHVTDDCDHDNSGGYCARVVRDLRD
jgi:hypothetical protein